MYCTVQNIIDAITYRELAVLSNDNFPEEVNNTLVEDFITSASAFIDAHIQARYELPLESSHIIIQEICIDITIRNLYKRRGQGYNETIKSNYEDALRILEKIQTGKLVLSDTTYKSPILASTDKETVFPFTVNL